MTGAPFTNPYSTWGTTERRQAGSTALHACMHDVIVRSQAAHRTYPTQSAGIHAAGPLPVGSAHQCQHGKRLRPHGHAVAEGLGNLPYAGTIHA